MLEAMHRSVIVILASLGALAASATFALAHSTPYAWTVSKARVMLQEGTNVSLPEAERAALIAEAQGWLDKLRPLQLTAGSDPENRYWRQAAMYKNYIDRFVDIRDTVARGLSIDSVKCAGQGKALTGKRYKHFRCNAASYVLEVPNIELVPGADPFLPEVVEGPRRIVGPLQAVFTVHVTGKARMLSQRAS
jgi:hypothetical protein